MTDIDLDALIEQSVVAAQIESGVPLHWVAKNTDERLAMLLARGIEPQTERPQPWSPAEEQFVLDNLGFLSDEEMGRRLGRTTNSIKIRRVRKSLGSASRRDTYYSARDVAEMLGVSCAKRVSWFIREGFLRGYEAPLGRLFYQVNFEDIKRFACNPMYWVYFNPRRVRHPYLRRLVLRQMRRWNDEWWDAKQAAAYHGVKLANISHAVATGKIKGVRFGKWYVRRSDATDPELVVATGKGAVRRAVSDKLEPLDGFFVAAMSLGLSAKVANDLSHNVKDSNNRYLFLKNTNRLPVVAEKYGLPLQFNERGDSWLPWSKAVGRFPCVDRAVRKFVAHGKCTPRDYRTVAGLLGAWAAFHAMTDEQKEIAIKLSTFSMARERSVRAAWASLLSWGKGDPLC